MNTFFLAKSTRILSFSSNSSPLYKALIQIRYEFFEHHLSVLHYISISTYQSSFPSLCKREGKKRSISHPPQAKYRFNPIQRKKMRLIRIRHIHSPSFFLTTSPLSLVPLLCVSLTATTLIPSTKSTTPTNPPQAPPPKHTHHATTILIHTNPTDTTGRLPVLLTASVLSIPADPHTHNPTRLISNALTFS